MGYEVRHYKDENGRYPYRDWITSFKDIVTKSRVISRVSRIESGNLGDHKSVGDDVLELRLDFGAGYRIYFTIIHVSLSRLS